MLDAGCWLLDTGFWILDTRYWMLDTGCWLLYAGYLLLVAGRWMLVTGSWTFVTGYSTSQRFNQSTFQPPFFSPINFDLSRPLPVGTRHTGRRRPQTAFQGLPDHPGTVCCNRLRSLQGRQRPGRFPSGWCRRHSRF